MIDEAKQQVAIDYILGELSPADSASFERELSQDDELRQFTRELTDSVASMALATPPIQPRPELFLRVRAKTHTAKRSNIVAVLFLPWAVAACFAIACLILGLNNVQTRNLLAELRQRDALAQLQIASLQAQVNAYAKASAIVVWNPQRQRGLLRLVSLPAAESGHDYQLWIVDPDKKTPVSAGIVTVGKEGGANIEFGPVQRVTSATGFALSVEKAGGSTTPQGQIILAGR